VDEQQITKKRKKRREKKKMSGALASIANVTKSTGSSSHSPLESSHHEPKWAQYRYERKG
jgi:hypothetical protein